ncbi:MAG TPA: dihydrofolate reductase [Sphingobacteriaceae bacterium]|nr:dihydrofolate reductase [Sphingobacteriaceae bacterium]
MIISNVVVVDENLGIGKNNGLLVHFPADLKHFKRITTGHTVIMGRKTYDSVGKALPNRRNIVITRQKDYVLADAEVKHSLSEALDICKDENEVFVVGGAEIFKQALPESDKIYLTRIHKSFDADTFFPEIDSTWKEAENEKHQPDEKNPFTYSFITYVRR